VEAQLAGFQQGATAWARIKAWSPFGWIGSRARHPCAAGGLEHGRAVGGVPTAPRLGRKIYRASQGERLWSRKRMVSGSPKRWRAAQSTSISRCEATGSG